MRLVLCVSKRGGICPIAIAGRSKATPLGTPEAQDARPILVPDVSADPPLSPLRDAILSEGIQALAFIPIGHHGRLLGKFMVYYDQPHDFSDLDLKVASMVTHYVAFGLDRVREAAIGELLRRERDARREAETLNRVKDDFLAVCRMNYGIRSMRSPMR